MTLATATKLLELKDVRISQLLTDPSSGSATYATSVDLPGITKLGIKPVTDKKELAGDNQILDVWSKVKQVQFDFEHGKMSLDALKILLGGSYTSTGVSPSQVTTYSLGANDRPSYFKIEGQVMYTDVAVGGDVHFILWKALAEDAPSWDVADMSGNFASVKGSGVGIPRLSDAKMFDIVFNETAVANS